MFYLDSDREEKGETCSEGPCDGFELGAAAVIVIINIKCIFFCVHVISVFICMCFIDWICWN